ncbi:ABC transporter permease [Streptococcus oralis subsp. tigurinus]|jgi:ABC superfamily ATP binding cassette transporter, permease protein|uniref:ABC transporter permease n=1 Tax=Streptococcus oralis TaxID=1303 RepID=UPI001BD51837|nr:ABC transporter permease [Streptococcus oralis]MBS9401571.1 ABC transporter permease [Streptococcus oralis]MCY7087609.1 ABC transporter permease [Streptococcus oralis]MDB6209909.1 ABC transporter permease [Streptococcus oralis]URK67503.1 ABC transporter permease [Streptococcus oralis]
MFRKLNALLWLRLQVLISNSTLLATLLMPFGIAILYNEFLNKSGELSMFLLSMSLTMVLSMGSGYMVSIMMAEDKEKRNLKSLILSGVTATEYTLSMMALPLLVMLLSMVVLPLYLKVDLTNYFLTYGLYLLLATISIIFLNLLIGAVSDTQSKAQVYSIFPMLTVSFLPVLAVQNETAQKLLDYSFIGPLVSLLKEGGGELSLRSLALLLAWVLLLGLASLFVLKNSYKGK